MAQCPSTPSSISGSSVWITQLSNNTYSGLVGGQKSRQLCSSHSSSNTQGLPANHFPSLSLESSVQICIFWTFFHPKLSLWNSDDNRNSIIYWNLTDSFPLQLPSVVVRSPPGWSLHEGAQLRRQVGDKSQTVLIKPCKLFWGKNPVFLIHTKPLSVSRPIQFTLKCLFNLYKGAQGAIRSPEVDNNITCFPGEETEVQNTKWFAQFHRAGRRQSQDTKPDSLTPDPCS